MRFIPSCHEHDSWQPGIARAAPEQLKLLIGHDHGSLVFDANWIVEELGQRGAKVVISHRSKRLNPLDIDLEMSKWWHLIENFFAKRKELKRNAMRACKADQSFLALIQLCSAVINSR